MSSRDWDKLKRYDRARKPNSHLEYSEPNQKISLIPKGFWHMKRSERNKLGLEMSRPFRRGMYEKPAA